MTAETIANQENPLITFALVAYNQERFIREAVEGALAQNYDPLEIILSDDCSTDDTYKIIEQLAKDYQGPHMIVLNRNAVNMGIGNHVNLVVQMAKGNLIVGAAGDDVSYPNRTEELYNAWIATNCTACSIVSGYELIDETGKTVSVCNSLIRREDKDLIHRVKHGFDVHGATHAFTKDTFRVFGLLDSDCAEDRIIGFRSYLLGQVIEVPQPLIKYRQHCGNLWNKAPANFKLKQKIESIIEVMSCNIAEKLQLIRDTTNKKIDLCESDRVQALCILSNELKYYLNIKRGLQGNFAKKIATLLLYLVRKKVRQAIYHIEK